MPRFASITMAPVGTSQTIVRSQYAAVTLTTVSENSLRARLPLLSMTRIVGFHVPAATGAPVIAPVPWSIECPRGIRPAASSIV